MKSKLNHRSQNKKDLGFGSIATDESRLRLINPDGSFNVERKGLNFFTSLSLYHFLLKISWLRFFLLTALGYVFMNAVFAEIYMLIGNEAIAGSASNSKFELFLNAFFFSVQTSSTIGFGHMTPVELSVSR